MGMALTWGGDITRNMHSKIYPSFILTDGFMVSGVRCQDGDARELRPDTSYETPGLLNSEPQNIEYRTAELRRIDSLHSIFFVKQIEFHDRCAVLSFQTF